MAEPRGQRVAPPPPPFTDQLTLCQPGGVEQIMPTNLSTALHARTFPRNQDLTVKLNSEFIVIKFQYFFYVLAHPRPICRTLMILSMSEP